MSTLQMVWFCRKCDRKLKAASDESRCPACGGRMQALKQVQTRKPKAQRPPDGDLLLALQGIERDLIRKGELHPHDATMPVDDDIPF